MKQKSITLAIKTLLCIGVIAVCFIVYTLVSPVAMTDQQTPTLTNQPKDATQSAVKAKSKKKSCGCCAERMERLRKAIKQQTVSPEPESAEQETEDQEVAKKPQ